MTTTHSAVSKAVLLGLVFLTLQAGAAGQAAGGKGNEARRPQQAGTSSPKVRRTAPARGERHANDRILVRFRESASRGVRQGVHAMAGGVQSRGVRLVSGLEIVQLAPGMQVREAVRQYLRDPNVLYAEPDYRVQALEVPSDPYFPQLWNLQNTGQSGFTPGADIDALGAWSITTGSPDVVVGLIDTGIDYTHPDLEANVFSNAADCNTNGIDDDGNGYVDDCHGVDLYNYDSDPMDDVGHGTHVAGTIGAVGNNGVGVVGVNWQVKIVTCKFLGADGGLTSDAIRCLDYLRTLQEQGVNLVATSNSWGGGGVSQALQDAIDAHRQAGILFIAAAGNDTLNNDGYAVYPANYHLPNVISVAATNGFDELTYFSNYGRHTVHLGAPGESILSTLPGGSYGAKSGTSMATPHVAGVAALLKAQDASRDWRAIKNLILAGGEEMASLADTITSRRLNAHGALACSNSGVLRRTVPTGDSASTTVGTPVDFEALHIDCALPAGEVVATVAPSGESFPLHDDGEAPDLAAGDGIYTAAWVPSAPGTYTVSLADSEVSVYVLSGYKYAAENYSYRTITGTSLGLQTDWSEFAWITPPFPIHFGGGSFSNIGVSAHGTISFADSFSDWWWTPLPNPTATTLVAPSWTWLWLSGSENVYWSTIGTAPNRQLVVEWRNVEWYWCFGPTITFQVVFFENSSDIVFNYKDMLFGTDNYGADCSVLDNGGGATSGIQIGPRIATQYSYEEPVLHSGSAIRWTAGAPQPKLTDILPFSAAVGEPDFDLEVWGTNFQPTSAVQWNGADRSTTFLDSTHLKATIPATDLNAAMVAQITVATPGGGASEPHSFTVYDSYPVPSITAINPGPEFWVGGKATLLVTGTDFVSRSVLRRDGIDRDTEVLSPTHLKTYLTTADFAHAGTVNLTVANPQPGGGASAAFPVTVKNPAPQITALEPQFKRVGADEFQLQVSVSGLGDSVVRWNGSDRATTVDITSFNELVGGYGYAYATIPASDVAQAGTAQITIYNAGPGGGTSAPAGFDIVLPPVNDDVAQAIAVTALPFSDTRDTRAASVHPTDPGSVCSWMSNDPTTVWFRYEPSQAANVYFDTSGGDYFQTISVWSGQPGAWSEAGCGSHNWFQNWGAQVDVVPGTTYWIVVREDGNAFAFGLPVPPLTFTAVQSAAVPVLKGVTPGHAPGGWETPVQLIGSNFTPASVVVMDGWQSLTTVFVSPTELTATLASPASGDHTITVSTPPPGGGSSAALPLKATGFELTVTPGSVTIPKGGTAQFTATISPDALGFDKPVQFACGLMPPVVCTFSVESGTPGTTVMTSTVTIKASVSAANYEPAQHREIQLALLVLPGIVAGALMGAGNRKRFWLALGGLLIAAGLLLSCGGGGVSSGGGGGGPNNGQPVRYPVHIFATSGGLERSTWVDIYVQP